MFQPITKFRDNIKGYFLNHVPYFIQSNKHTVGFVAGLNKEPTIKQAQVLIAAVEDINNSPIEKYTDIPN